MTMADVIGYLAGSLTTIAVIPQIVKAWKTHDVDSISVVMVLILLSGLGLWVTYGALTTTWPIIITNGLSFLLYCFLLGFVIKEKSKRNH